MSANSHLPHKDQKLNQILSEVSNKEKQLWALIHKKGLLCSDVQELHRKVCSSYEKILLGDHEQAQFQDAEYSLWKLHYKHIDEFRKRIKGSSANEVPQNVANSNDSHIKNFRMFLLEATEYYGNLIVRIRRCYGLPEEPSLFKRSDISTPIEAKKLQNCRFLCHRILVCIGDLARYREQYEKSGAQNHNWSVAAKHYLEASMIWPDSGNPQNQLAVLATYVGDEFLALYHCVRSLAVKEPFPDAWNNLILLFERNQSSHLASLSGEVQFDFTKPYQRSSSAIESERDSSPESNLWQRMIRTMGFFFIKSSLEDFPSAFASTMRELDLMLALDDATLKTILESYQLMDSARTGPFRVLQVVSLFIFIFESLINSSEKQLELVQFAVTSMFIFMGRFVDRCLKANPLSLCPLLPAVLVFVEWLAASRLSEAEKYGVDGKSKKAMSYFFGTFVELLKQFNLGGEFLSCERTALWEDYELIGFAPIAHLHASLDLSSHSVHTKSSENGFECRAQRIIIATMMISNRSSEAQKWIVYDKLGRGFCVESAGADPKVEEPQRLIHEDTEEFEKQIFEEVPSNSSVHGKSVAVEEEEIILFKPLARYNSAPLCKSLTIEDPDSRRETEEQNLPSDECLRRATSLLIAQNQAQGDPFTFHSDIASFKCQKNFKQPESHIKDTMTRSSPETPVGAGPPSLSAWVLNLESFSNGEKGKFSNSRTMLSPIEEIASASMTSLSLSESEVSVVSSVHESTAIPYSFSHPYTAPVPSAPLLPDDALWFKDVPSGFLNCKDSMGTNKVDNFGVASPVSSYSNWAAACGPLDYGLGNGYIPLSGLTSSEWLRQYRATHNVDHSNNHARPIHFYVPGNPGNFPDHDVSRRDLYDQWGYLASSPAIHADSPLMQPGFPLVYGAEEPRREKLFHGYQRPNPYGCGAVTDLRDEPPPLLQYLKEKEWLLQRDPTLRGPTYMGN